MFRFLRTIRQRLLSESRFGRYFLYAIGEISLVMIGILLALQVNTWNQGRQDRKQEVRLLRELQKEFTSDSLELARFIFLTNFKVEEGRKVKAFLLGTPLGRDTLINYAFFNGRMLTFQSFTPTYDEIIATGQQGIIRSDEVKDLIREYKDHLGNMEGFLLEECKSIKEAYNFHLYRYFERGILPELWNKASVQNRFVPIDSLGDFITDLEGFRQDPESLYFVTMNAGADGDLNRSYRDQTMTRLARVLGKLRETSIQDDD